MVSGGWCQFVVVAEEMMMMMITAAAAATDPSSRLGQRRRRTAVEKTYCLGILGDIYGHFSSQYLKMYISLHIDATGVLLRVSPLYVHIKNQVTCLSIVEGRLFTIKLEKSIRPSYRRYVL